jgi:hypothetical protein
VEDFEFKYVDSGKNNGEMIVEEQDVDLSEWEMEKFMLPCGI